MDLSNFEFSIDFKGQEKVDKISKKILSIAIINSVLLGFIKQDITYVLYTFGAHLIVLFVIGLPAWPAYNKNPVDWLRVKYD